MKGMIRMGQKFEALRLYFNENKGKRAIVKELGISKNSVKLYINEYFDSKKEQLETSTDKYYLIKSMVGVTKYEVGV